MGNLDRGGVPAFPHALVPSAFADRDDPKYLSEADQTVIGKNGVRQNGYSCARCDPGVLQEVSASNQQDILRQTTSFEVN